MNTLDVPIISRDNERIYLYKNHDVWFGRATIKIASGKSWMCVGEVVLKKKDGSREDAIVRLESLIRDVRGMPATIYIIKGVNDHAEWYVAAYVDIDLAEEHCQKINSENYLGATYRIRQLSLLQSVP